MLEHGVPCGKIYRAPEMLADPHFAAREALVKVMHPEFGDITMQNAFPKLSETPGSRALGRAGARPAQRRGATARCSGSPPSAAPSSPRPG